MISTALKEQAIEAIKSGGLSPDGQLSFDSVTVFLKGSKAHETIVEDPTKLPLGNFEHGDAQYAVYAK